MDDLENLEVTDLERWYRKWYAPNNATVVVVGDVDPEAVYALAKKYFGPLPPEEIPTLKPRGEPPQDGARRVTVKAPAQVPYLLMGYKVPALLTAEHDWEPYALDVLSYILDGGDYARLTKNLVRGSQVAASASAGYDPYDRLESLFLLVGVPASGHSVAELETALRAEMERLRAEPVDPNELARVKTQVVAENVFERDSVFYQAMEIGELETVGLGWRTADAYVDRIRAVTPEQVQAVARKYLTDDGVTVGILDPQPMQTAQAADTAASPDTATLLH
jgi:zinc protease